ncbi:hypothetical protein EDC04DRAFT_2600351 [Pisolithus marmoratus]|nr:hypothetical protein EDC04DRAFT_2600351 [Pisolithus marmoratus]
MAPSCCQTLLRHSPHASVQSLGCSPANVPLSCHTSSTTTEELLAKIVRVMDVVEKDMKQQHSAEQAQALAEHKCSDLQSNVSTFAASQAYITKCIIFECGHSFCYECLKIWFHMLLEKQINWRPSIPIRLKSAPFTADKLKQLFEEGHIFSTRVFLTADLITVIGTLVPQDFPENNPPPSNESIWADIFYVKTNE